MCDVCHGIGNCPVCSPEPEIHTCETCNGTGKQYFYQNPTTGGIIEVTKDEYNHLPKADRFNDYCEDCEGDGEVTEQIETPITARERRMRYWEDYDKYHEPNFKS